MYGIKQLVSAYGYATTNDELVVGFSFDKPINKARMELADNSLTQIINNTVKFRVIFKDNGFICNKVDVSFKDSSTLTFSVKLVKSSSKNLDIWFIKE